jgi:hypothetical protein
LKHRAGVVVLNVQIARRDNRRGDIGIWLGGGDKRLFETERASGPGNRIDHEVKLQGHRIGGREAAIVEQLGQ